MLQGFAFLALAAVAVWGYLTVFAPKPYDPPPVPFDAYDRKPMLDAVAPAAVRERLDEVAATGDRFLGKPGFYRAEAYIRDQYRAAGLDMLEQEIRTVAPVTEFAEALDAAGAPAGFAVYPFLPNYLQPVATPDEGITATLVRVDDQVLRSRASFKGCFALIDAAQPLPRGYGCAFAKYAQLGFEGVIVSHAEGLEKLTAATVTSMNSFTPVNYLRVAADPGIFAHEGKPVTIRARVRFAEVPNRTLVGILKSGKARREALVVPCSYDALSVLPDHSPGLLQALPVAIQLQLLEGLKPQREALRRDVIFVAFGGRFMAQDPQDRLLAAIGSSSDRKARRDALAAEQSANATALERVRRCLPVVEALAGPDAAALAVDRFGALDGDASALFVEQLRYVLNTVVRERSESVLMAKIRFEKGDKANVTRPEYDAYQATRKAYDKAFSCAGIGFPRLMREESAYVADVGLPARMAARMAALASHHERKAKELEQGLALNAAFAAYDKIVVLAPELMPAKGGNAAASSGSAGVEPLTMTMGSGILHTTGWQPASLAIQAVIQQLKLGDRVTFLFKPVRNYGDSIRGMMSDQEAEVGLWARLSYPAYSIVSNGRSYAAYGDPGALPWMRDMASLEGSLKVVGAVALSVAYGNGDFKPLTFSQGAVRRLAGNVFVANVGQSILPDYPLVGAVVVGKPVGSGIMGPAERNLYVMSDVYGRYGRAYSLIVQGGWGGVSVDAAGHDAQGRIELIKDEGPTAQRMFASMGLGIDALANDVNLICYRAAPVTLLDLINPQSMSSYAGAEFLRAQGLSAFENSFGLPPGWAASEGLQTAFIRPDEYACVTLRAGAAENPLVQTTRAFMLGDPADGKPSEAGRGPVFAPGRELESRGFLAAETPLIRDVAREAARSMTEVNGRRLALQDSFGMADEQTHVFQERSAACLERAGATGQSRKASLLASRDALTYATLNHPVLRRNIFEAVVGILWYLGLLVPFAFFFEKLAFGFSDIRKQLAAHVVIFLVVFTLLKLLHPAFAMIRSSVMILLGFIIFLISTGILAMFSSRFKENLEGLKRSRGQVTAAEVNKAGAIMTAFMLGLNNMHRRRVRTMLTCATLVLITFVMICFTSVRSDITDTSVAVGKAPFNGLVVKNEEFRPVSEAEVFALQTKFGDRYRVASRSVLTGWETYETRERQVPHLRVVHRDGGSAREAASQSVVTLDPNEPLAPGLAIRGRWFTEADVRTPGRVAPVMLPRSMADRLGLDLAALEAGTLAEVEINGSPFPVCGVFEGKALDALLDLDGCNLLPFDIKALRDVNKVGNVVLASDDDPRVAGDDVILSPNNLGGMSVPGGSPRILSVAVAFPPSVTPREARAEIEQFMEQSGRRTYYGLDGYAFLGKRARESSFVGLVDMLIPLIIAAITVLNTIRGSVYERKEEIFVYNAVGIAPRHIFFMFFAEAFVYAVVGSVMGYILSQGTGRLLTALDLTGGLNMTFTSLGTIYASLTIAASVFVSTWFPARTAMRIAAPSEDLGWKLPEAEGDRLQFRLPFTFDWHDRIAVLAFFRRYFVDHGEGSSGPFFVGTPELGVDSKPDPLEPGRPIPTITVPVWLKPFDLGVSQSLEIALPRDSETGEYVAEITLHRRSGTLENWRRLNPFFVGKLREHFLHWRAVKREEREAMFAEARGLYQA